MSTILENTINTTNSWILLDYILEFCKTANYLKLSSITIAGNMVYVDQSNDNSIYKSNSFQILDAYKRGLPFVEYLDIALNLTNEDILELEIPDVVSIIDFVKYSTYKGVELTKAGKERSRNLKYNMDLSQKVVDDKVSLTFSYTDSNDDYFETSISMRLVRNINNENLIEQLNNPAMKELTESECSVFLNSDFPIMLDGLDARVFVSKKLTPYIRSDSYGIMYKSDNFSETNIIMAEFTLLVAKIDKNDEIARIYKHVFNYLK